MSERNASPSQSLSQPARRSASQLAIDEAMMRRAIMLARRAAGWTNPNPLVGAVIVKDGRIIGEGCHERYGEAHAERNALASCTEDPAGATLYVSLEPCCHQGKQPPCTEAVIGAGITRVVVGSRDPNPLVSGKGNAQLRAAGIEVVEDVLRARCDALNPIFFHYIRTGKPYVVAKWAMTLDGKIATHTGDARWVSGEESRKDAHELRHRLAAVMAGIGTVLADDPMLNARCDHPCNQPLRIVVDSRLRIPRESKLVQTAREYPLLVATALPEDDERAQVLRDAGVEILSLPAMDGEGGLPAAGGAIDSSATDGDVNPSVADGKVDLAALMDVLGARGIDSVLVEGGAGIHAAMFAADLVDETIVYLAPKICGGKDAPGPVGGTGARLMADAMALGEPRFVRLGTDLKVSCLRHAGESGEEGSCSRG